VVRRLLRKGRYYDNPHLYVKTPRTDGRGDVAYSLITPEMDASYLDAEEQNFANVLSAILPVIKRNLEIQK
jgi:hypothetical protein